MKIIIGNWKMNGTPEMVDMFTKGLNQVETSNKIVLCPPMELLGYFRNFKHALGAQNCSYSTEGAFTGETSAASLRRIGCEYVMLGHSERRKLFAETSDVILHKWKAALKEKLTPIVCVGESDKQDWINELGRQLCIFLEKDLSSTIMAYEPVWCIGTGEAPSSEQMIKSIEFIKKVVKPAGVVYGGSVNVGNYKSILTTPRLDGVLVGGASLRLEDFSEIARYA